MTQYVYIAQPMNPPALLVAHIYNTTHVSVIRGFAVFAWRSHLQIHAQAYAGPWRFL